MRTFDVIAYFEDRGIEYTFEGKNISSGGAWVGINCPHCGDSNFHGAVNLHNKAYSCFRCTPTNNSILNLIATIENCSERRAWGITRKYQNLDCLFEKEQELIRTSKIEIPSGVSKNFSQSHIDYLTSRRLDPNSLIKKYDLYCGGLTGDFKFRIVAPIYHNYTMVTLVGRDITGKAKQPYKALPAERSVNSTKEVLYNIDTVKDTAVIVEGIFDVWRIGDSAVATMGTKYTHQQLRLLRGVERVFIMFDADATKEAHKMAASLYGIANHIEVLELTEGDPCDLNEEDVTHLRKELSL